jgi:hypothetical protein
VRQCQRDPQRLSQDWQLGSPEHSQASDEERSIECHQIVGIDNGVAIETIVWADRHLNARAVRIRRDDRDDGTSPSTHRHVARKQDARMGVHLWAEIGEPDIATVQWFSQEGAAGCECQPC